MTEQNQQTHRGDHETSDIKIRSVLAAAAILVTFLVIAHLILMGLLEAFTREPAPPKPTPFALEEQLGPQLQIAPAQDLQVLIQAKEAILTSYGWVDREAGIVRIPIERAMDLLVEQGRSLKPREKVDIQQLMQQQASP